MSDATQTNAEQASNVASHPQPADAAPPSSVSSSSATSTGSGPLNLEQIRKLREASARTDSAGGATSVSAAMEGVTPLLKKDPKSKPPKGERKPRPNEEDDGPRKPFRTRKILLRLRWKSPTFDKGSPMN